jgi:hypothetical protein
MFNRKLLGRYLIMLARVADEMDYEADERLLRDNVNNNPPLHIRRTLDQYYFLTLDDTSVRDKDQVVYRGTRAGRSFHNRNTRVVMVDQLWLWILDDSEYSSSSTTSHTDIYLILSLPPFQDDGAGISLIRQVCIRVYGSGSKRKRTL